MSKTPNSVFNSPPFLTMLFFVGVLPSASISPSASTKKLSVYTPEKSYSLEIIDSTKFQYVDLVALLKPLGSFEEQQTAGTFRLKLNGTGGEFAEGKKLARIGAARLLLPAKAIVERGRLLVPVRSLPNILEKYLGQHCELRDSEAGRTISIAGAPVATVPQAQSATLSAANAAAVADPIAPPATAAQDSATKTAPPTNTIRFFVMIDPAHGGDDPGARFSDKLSEKDITLAIARKLRTELQDHGVPAQLLRDGDSTLTYDQRAVSSNAQRAGLYVAIHAGTPGTGVRVYTAMLQSAALAPNKTNGAFLPWDTAQAGFLERSRIVGDSLMREMGHAEIASAYSSAPLKPLNNIAAPAVAIEVAPPFAEAKADSLVSAKYQQNIATAVANAIVAIRARIEERP